jgi:hypothetical protein
MASKGDSGLPASIEQFTKLSESQVRQLHGMGPKAMDQIPMALAGQGLSFASSD